MDAVLTRLFNAKVTAIAEESLPQLDHGWLWRWDPDVEEAFQLAQAPRRVKLGGDWDWDFLP